MKLQEIEIAVRKQLPGKKEAHTFLRTNGNKYYDLGRNGVHVPIKPVVGNYENPALGLIIFCGLSGIFITDAINKVTGEYDITKKEFRHYSELFHKHINRVATVIRCYAVNVKSPDAYRKFANAFWHQHNTETAGEVGKSGIILSHILSTKKEYKKFLRKEDSCFIEDDFTSFYIFNKAQLAKNFLSVGIKKEFVALLDFGF